MAQRVNFSEDLFNSFILPEFDPAGWEMTPSEKMIFVELLRRLTPKFALEIGSRAGGSMQVLTQFCDKILCLDIDSTIATRLSTRFPKTSFVIGDSKQILPKLLEDLIIKQEFPNFIHLDGDHSEEGAFLDLSAVLSTKPPHDVVILMHDTFNPIVRRGLLKVDFNAMPYLHYADIDFAPGVLHERPVVKDEMWGGFSLFIMKAQERVTPLSANTYLQRMNDTIAGISVHRNS
ncbi:MAG: class I SAM-dependent methyltransferase [Proteobacteria bacterium]|nr:MAG: class I SAM-dependent methyltransferase [Pseudomonadota bacterium]